MIRVSVHIPSSERSPGRAWNGNHSLFPDSVPALIAGAVIVAAGVVQAHLYT
jgi:hypothetical protein